MLELLNNIDTNLFLFLNSLHSSFFDPIMHWISGKLSWLPLYILIIGYLIWHSKIKSIWIILSLILLIVLSDQLSVHLFKNVFERLRPCHNSLIADQVHLVNNHCGGKYGFLSSHASNTFALAGFLTFLFRAKWISISLLIWAGVVSYSRIYLGVHYPFDVLCGALFGLILSFIMVIGLNRFLGKFYKQENN